MSTAETWTIGRLLNWTTDYLRNQGSESPRLEAEILLAAARDCSRIELYTSFGDPASEATRSAYRELIRRRAEGVPVAYLVGRREFFSLDFRVAPDVLIPRPETEMIVVALLDLARERTATSPPLCIADVGTGSGVLAVCAARHLPQATVVATDTSGAALAVAQANAEQHQVADRIEFVECDLLADVEGEFDFIVSNPPYVSTAEFAALPDDVRKYEPRQALLAGDRGTEVIERLLPVAATRLRPGGFLLMELSPMIADAVQRLIQAEAQLSLEQTILDHAEHVRVVVAGKV